MLRADVKGRQCGYNKKHWQKPQRILICRFRVFEVLFVVGGSPRHMTDKEHHCLIGNPPMQRPLLLCMWGAAGHPVWVTHEMVFGTSSTHNFCNGLINATAARLKVTSGQTAVQTTMRMWIGTVIFRSKTA